MKEIDKSTVKAPEYVEIFKKEPHHGHPVIEDANQILRWKKTQMFVDAYLNLI